MSDGAESDGVEKGATENGAAEKAATEKAATENAATENAATENAATEKAATENAATENAATENAATEKGATESGATENGAAENAAENGAAESGATEKAATGNTATENGSAENAATENAATENAATENAATENAATENAATENVATENVATENVATENVAAPVLPPVASPPDSRVGPIGVALIAMFVALGGYLFLSVVGTFINMAFSVVLAQLGLLASTVIVVRLSRRSLTRFTGLVGSKPRAFFIGGAVGLGNALLVTGPLHVFSKSLFPEWLVKMFDMSELMERMDFLPIEKLSFFVAAVAIAPIVEELLFRGVFFRALSGWNAAWAAVITAAVFSAYHLDPVGLLARFEIGLVLAWLFWRTKSLGACIGAHAANNVFAMAGTLVAGEGHRDPTEPIALTDWLPWLAVGALIFIPAVRALWRSQPADWAIAADDPETPRRSFFPEVLPWAMGTVLAIALVLRLDPRGPQLALIDLTVRVRAAKTPLEHHEREVLKRLRRAARAGTGSVWSYSELRRELSRREGR